MSPSSDRPAASAAPAAADAAEARRGIASPEGPAGLVAPGSPSGPAIVGAALGDPSSRWGRPPARNWFARDPLVVAGDLLGTYLTHRTDDGDVTVRITEVEAYRGADDPGSHAYRGRTGRNQAMFGEPGRLYVYRHLGLHHCVNVVCGPAGQAGGVLIRAGEVVGGAELAWERRSAGGVVDSPRQLARGPGRLTVALGITMLHYGQDVTEAGGPVVLTRDRDSFRQAVSTGPRVGVSGAGGDAGAFPWRLWLTGDPTVSPYRPAYRRTPAPL